MGVGVIGSLWPGRPAPPACSSSTRSPPCPKAFPAGTPVQAHVADGDRFAPPGQLAAFQASAAHAGAEAALHTYPGAGHFYTDPSLPDYNPVAAARTWQHIDAFLSKARLSHIPLTPLSSRLPDPAPPPPARRPSETTAHAAMRACLRMGPVTRTDRRSHHYVETG